MKKIFNMITVLSALIAVSAGCTQYTEYEQNDTEGVKTLLYPADGFELTLINQSNANLNFEWEPAEGAALYTVVFYGGDGVTEITRMLSNDSGARNMLTVKQQKMIEIADIAGILPEGTGDLYWTAYASSGMNIQKEMPAPRKITVTRDAKAVYVPSELYVTGEGSEAGEDIAAALPLRPAGDGRFELFTRIAGEFSLVNRNEDGAKKTWYVTGDMKLTENPENAVEFSNAVYRLNVDFNSNSATLEEVKALSLYRANNEKLADLEYAGNGVWKKVYTIPTGGDDRYRFVAEVENHRELWSSDRTDRDASDPGTIDPSSPYFNVYVKTDEGLLDDSYQACYKFHSPVKGMEVTVVMDMSEDQYRHYFDFGFDLEAPAVEVLSAPENGASIALQAIEGAKVSFSWEKPADCPQLPLTTYSLVFFKDEAGNERLSSFDASYGSSIDITHEQLEAVATAAGIAAESEGDLYWGVESKLISYTAMSPINEIKVTRMKGVPAELYITGEATEYGSEYGKLKSVSTGRFEIFTRLSRGSYRFTDKASADGRTFIIDGSSFKESQTAGSWNEENIYRITVDAINGTATIEKIGVVYMQSCVDKGNHIVMDYVGEGVWLKENVVPDFRKDFEDTRFFIKMTIDGTEWKLANQRDFGGSDPESAAPERDPAYAVKFWDDTSDWDYHYKVIKSYRGQNTKALDIKLNCSPEEDFYYVYVNYLN